jgi:hypothetical protein
MPSIADIVRQSVEGTADEGCQRRAVALYSHQRVYSLEGTVVGRYALVEEELGRLGRVPEDGDSSVVAGCLDGERHEGAATALDGGDEGEAPAAAL